jgi:hypothetical protein
MLVYIHLEALIYGVLREFVVVGKANDVVTKRAIDAVYAIGIEVALVEYAINARMGVDVCALPAVGAISILIGVVDVGPREWSLGTEVVDGAKTCTYDDA